MQSCSIEESVLQNKSNIKTVSKNEAILFLRNQNTLSNTIAKTTNFNLDFDFEKITQEQLTNTSELLTVIPIKTKIQNHRSRALILRIGDTIKTMIYNEFTAAFSTKNSFDGIIVMTRLNGDFIRAYKLKNNKYITDLAPKKGNKTGQNGTQSTTRTIDGSALHEVIVINSYKDPSTFVSLNEMGKEVPISISWNSMGSGGDSPSSAEVTAQDIVDRIDDSKLPPCLVKIISQLKNLSESNIADIFEKFGIPKDGVYNIRIILGTPEDPNAVADTKLDGSKNNYVITIRETYINGTNNNNRPPTTLAIASVLVHELIHAHFMSLYDDYKNNGDVCALDNYDCLFMKYAANNYVGTTDPHHTQMFESYLDVMANALQGFHTNVPVKTEASQLYQDLAISTLQGTQLFEDKYPNDYNAPNYEERKRIAHTRLAEDNNTTLGIQEPQGKPCN